MQEIRTRAAKTTTQTATVAPITDAEAGGELLELPVLSKDPPYMLELVDIGPSTTPLLDDEVLVGVVMVDDTVLVVVSACPLVKSSVGSAVLTVDVRAVPTIKDHMFIIPEGLGTGMKYVILYHFEMILLFTIMFNVRNVAYFNGKYFYIPFSDS